jgi:RND family efflux transporter MFP subunit
MRSLWSVTLAILPLLGCGGPPAEPEGPDHRVATGPTVTVRDTILSASFMAAGIAEPVERAILSTRLMGSVTQVLVQEGEAVRRGAVLARIDARELAARQAQVEAGIGVARISTADARLQAERFRSLYADSAATRYQLEQAELGLARAEAGLRTAEASAEELAATTSYAEVRAPFAGRVTSRMVDPGAFAAPGAPLLEIQDGSRLRIRVSAAPQVAGALRPGDSLDVRIDGAPARGVVEGVVPSAGGALSTINALVANPLGRFLPGSAAEVAVPQGRRSAIVIPTRAIILDGELTGVRIVTPRGVELRWIRSRATMDPALTEVLSGLTSGDVILDREH